MSEVPNLDQIRLRMLQAKETYVDRETLREWYINDILRLLARVRRTEEALTQETRISLDYQAQRDEVREALREIVDAIRQAHKDGKGVLTQAWECYQKARNLVGWGGIEPTFPGKVEQP